jgi:malate dehydrogenase (oxaloacetate-decarboxylating)(NADP+)
VAATKQLVNQHYLGLEYSPGVAAAGEEIVADPANAFRYTSRGDLVAVIISPLDSRSWQYHHGVAAHPISMFQWTSGTAVLGPGDIGPLAAKPVMESKALLFK